MPRLSFSGFDRSDEANARALFDGLGLHDWSLSEEADADAVLIDLDSMYGQMAWMKGLDAGKVSIGLTQALRADTTHRIDAPLTAEALRRVLLAIAGEPSPGPLESAVPWTPVEETPETTPAVPTPPPSEPAHTPPDTPAVSAPASVIRLAERIARAAGPFAVKAEGLPRLVIDPVSQQFAPGKSLKALLGYGQADLPADTIEPLDAAAEALRQAGDAQPLSRLVWLLALDSGGGQVRTHPPGTRFQLGKWPQAEREFPKHFRIATVMLKAPGTIAEIASASGASEAEVADYINAALAVGHAHAT